MSQITHRTAAFAQVGITLLFLFGYFAIAFAFILGYAKAAPEWKEAIIALLGVVTGSLTTIVSFWFSRQRSTGEEAPKA